MPPLAVGGFARPQLRGLPPNPRARRRVHAARFEAPQTRRLRALRGDGAHHVARSAFTCASRFDASAVSRDDARHPLVQAAHEQMPKAESRFPKCALGSSQKTRSRTIRLLGFVGLHARSPCGNRWVVFLTLARRGTAS